MEAGSPGSRDHKSPEGPGWEGAMRSGHSQEELLKEWNVRPQKEEAQMDPRADL